MSEESRVPVSNLICESRKRIELTGVTDSERFSDCEVILITVCGRLIIRGSELKVIALSVEDGEASVEGKIDSMVYTLLPRSGNESFLTRLFR